MANSSTVEMASTVGETGWGINFEYVRFHPDPSSEPTGVRRSIDCGEDEASLSDAQSILPFRFAPVGIDCYSFVNR
jgi:hypothetical protein